MARTPSSGAHASGSRGTPARFLTGSIMRHVTVMALTGTVGIVAVFAVDLLNFFYISRLGEKPIAAAVGFAGAIGFFQISIGIGLTIGIGAAVSVAIGRAVREAGPGDAPRIATTSLIAMMAITLAVGLATAAARNPLLDLLHAEGETKQLAAMYLLITSPALPLMIMGMGCGALLRSAGAARQAMNVTLYGAVAVAAMDPIFIFALHLRLEGAAISTVLSRAFMAGLGLYYLRRQGLLGRPDFTRARADLGEVSRVAIPAILTNLATPVGSAYVTHTMAQFGVAAVAGQAAIDRIMPVAFGVLFALTGAVGPIMAQNLGAGRADRVRETLRASLIFMVVAVVLAWGVLASVQDLLALAFSSKGVAAALLHLYCSWISGAAVFLGALFVANAAFNNLGRAGYATFLNWGRATLGTIPFVHVGAHFGPQGVVIGQAAGSVVFGAAAILLAFRVVNRLHHEQLGRVPMPIIAVPGGRNTVMPLDLDEAGRD
ncbi:MAG TPA: MATE family efflux transporter [Acidisoma sp.]|nr:MATE family efflux transporter [Acidisoma sp.]